MTPVHPRPTNVSVDGWHVTASCLRCGHRLCHVTAGQPVAGTQISAIGICPECLTEHQVMVRLLPMSPHYEARRAHRQERTPARKATA